MLSGKKIILGITGSIAAYKAALLTRLFVKAGAEVQVIMSSSGKEFITPVTLSALSGRPVLGDFFENKDGTWHSHVDLGLWADAMIIAPATANTMAKMVGGVCDNLLVTTYMSARCPVFLAPAMDLDMFQHPSTIRNMQTLEEWGCTIIEPGTGDLASGLSGKGRMEEPEVILDRLINHFKGVPVIKTLTGKRIMITAGPTYEAIDPVRFIGNYSSGKMGFAIAEELAKRGAHVDLVCGPVQIKIEHPGVYRHDVVTAQQMHDKCVELFPNTDAAIMAAAVSDYTPANVSDNKIKRSSDHFNISLKPNPDIAKRMGEMKKTGQILAGFALETDNEIANACEKLKKKHLDFIVLNSLAKAGAGFMTDTNQITIISKENKQTDFPLKSKREVAFDIVNYLETMMV
ncbi:bifunctional phosphopantothenoylcysteine decarboxylase/phosphopantothenate--cysteine ligase CoaBC [Alkalitalea saponilacus]|uniref:Coenzyme A biosynthesis bifunctional protein CoaBC n=1 Tax=Alkalitalea saponilacus TaxID=889453 RepID=A0A1T5FBZ1_9BACT|nr:bifunctional phosphopantothenoylcysteine decarboxylase/phosphopantothenate--cysteine ligase CoaBC [Alkalitalea saponilacus]ASB50081.1 phosphopantothenoylcysteine decarboxylase [Alkalitalea saponilacus]SKB93674.1 phosphopantothenoylcysteine decarboxylase / phosphopantothenate--cysteine ligase [Alkalitalea saponilacus]